MQCDTRRQSTPATAFHVEKTSGPVEAMVGNRINGIPVVKEDVEDDAKWSPNEERIQLYTSPRLGESRRQTHPM